MHSYVVALLLLLVRGFLRGFFFFQRSALIIFTWTKVNLIGLIQSKSWSSWTIFFKETTSSFIFQELNVWAPDEDRSFRNMASNSSKKTLTLSLLHKCFCIFTWLWVFLLFLKFRSRIKSNCTSITFFYYLLREHVFWWIHDKVCRRQQFFCKSRDFSDLGVPETVILSKNVVI